MSKPTIYIDARTGKLMDEGKATQPDLNNEKHLKVINDRQKVVNDGVINFNTDAVIEVEFSFFCCCGERIAIRTESKVELSEDGYTTESIMSQLKQNPNMNHCYVCGTCYEVVENDDEEIYIKIV